MNYTVNCGQANLDIRQPNNGLNIQGRTSNDWNLKLNNAVPSDIYLNCICGNNILNLANASLGKLRVQAGNGNTKVNLGGQQTISAVDLYQGCGNIDAAFTGNYSALNGVSIRTGSGDINVNLTGLWGNNAQIGLGSGSGNIVVRLPKTVGVRVHALTGSGNVSTEGLSLENNAYVNDLCDESSVTIDLNVEAGSGNIRLIST